MSKTIVVTGASGNLGIATVKSFIEKGYRVVAVGGSRGVPGFESSSNFEQHVVDLIKEEEATSFINNILARHQSIDGALLLAGGFAAGDIDATGGEELKKMYSLNFETAYHIARPLFRHMLDHGYGRIAFIGARPALVAAQGKNMVAYALSKSLLFKLSEFMNQEARGKDVVTSVIVPGTIDTPQNRESMPDANTDTWVKAEQIAEILEFICSDKSLPVREPVYKLYNNS